MASPKIKSIRTVMEQKKAYEQACNNSRFVGLIDNYIIQPLLDLILKLSK